MEKILYNLEKALYREYHKTGNLEVRRLFEEVCELTDEWRKEEGGGKENGNK